MKKIKISHELIARFVEGNTTAIETEMILRAAQKSSELRDRINFLFSMADDDDLEQTSTAKIVSLGTIPMWRLAAQNKSFNQNIKTVGDCVVRCEYEIIKVDHPEVTVDSLMQQSESEKWTVEGYNSENQHFYLKNTSGQYMSIKNGSIVLVNTASDIKHMSLELSNESTPSTVISSDL